MIDWRSEGDRAVTLLQELVRFPTVNRGTGESDDGHEHLAAERLAEDLAEAGLEPKLLEKKKGRTNVVARLRGTGAKPPLLLNAHLDVVEADEGAWKRPPFGGEIHEGYLWGRGTIDMKNMAAMSARVLALLARTAKEHGPFERDVIFAGVADEEAGSRLGAHFLVDEHPELVRAEYMLGEIGAFSLQLFGQTFYPIQVAEKGTCWVRASFRGQPGHGSMPDPDGAVVRLARAVERLGRSRMPMHPTEVVTDFLGRVARELPSPQRQVFERLKTPRVAALILDHLVRDPGQRRSFGAMLSNTASPNILRGGGKVNVIPSRASVDIDGRTLPGQTEAAFLRELREIMGKEGRDAEIEVLSSQPPVVARSDTPLFEHLAQTLRRFDPTAHPVPYLIPGFTDAKAYDRLGTVCYGFSPVRFDKTDELSFSAMYHGHDERIPTEGLKWGLEVLYEAVSSFCAGRRSK